MTWFTGTIVYILIWWTVIFMVLPWGLERDESGMPTNPRLKMKALTTTIVAAVIWIGLYFLIDADIISFREMAMSMY